MCHCFCYCGCIFRTINWHILSGFFTLIFAISLAMVKTNVKNFVWRVFFFQNWSPFSFFFFFFLDLCHFPVTCYSWVLLLKQKVVHSVLSFWLVCVILRSYMLILLWYLCNLFRYSKPMWLCVITANTRIQLDFPLRYWTWVVKYKSNYFGWKITQKVLKLKKLMTQISMFRLIYEKSNKIFILISSLLEG